MNERRFAPRALLVLLAAFFILGLASIGIAQEEEGWLEGENWFGTYDDQTGYGEDDWFYDEYDYGTGAIEDEWYGYGTEWTEDDEFFSGGWEDEGVGEGGQDDWFYDYYDDAGDEGFFDI